MKIVKIEFVKDDGTTMTLSYDDAKALYAVLKEMFGEKVPPLVTIPYYPNIQPCTYAS